MKTYDIINAGPQNRFMANGRIVSNSGRLLQLQNLSKNYIDTLEEARDLIKLGTFEMVESIYGNTPEILSQLVRTMLIPKQGCEFIIADYSAIEARVLAWEAGEAWRLASFSAGKDIYCESASLMFHVPVVKNGINGELRQKGKQAELACGYQGSVGAMIKMGALDMGIKESELEGIVDAWRVSNPNIVSYWWDMERAAVETVTNHTPTVVKKIKFTFSNGTLWMHLPSGRKLAYLKPKMQADVTGNRMSLTFEGLGMNNKWSCQETYGGKLTENATQAIARDILAEAMIRMEKAGLELVGSVHDEVIIEAPIGKYTVKEICDLMSINPKWCRDMPLSAAGYIGNYYYKD